MKKLMIVMIALVVVALCFVTYASNQDQWLGRENNRVTPVDTYELEYVYHRALYTSSLMDYREPYGVQSADEFDVAVYGKGGEALPESFAALEISEEASEVECVDALYGALEAYLPHEVQFTDFVISAETCAELPRFDRFFKKFVPRSDIDDADAVEHRFSFALAIDGIATDAKATVELRNGRVTKVEVADMERFLPYLELDLDSETLQSFIDETDKSWVSNSSYTVNRCAAISTGKNALYLVIQTEIIDNSPHYEGWFEDLDSEGRASEPYYVNTRSDMIHIYYVKLATLN